MVGASVMPLVGCSDEYFEDRTAQVTIDGRTSDFQVDSCGLDQETVFVVGRTDGGAVLQAVVGVSVDGEDTFPAATGLTVDVGGTVWGSFGPESWARRGQTGPAPGTITSAKVRGARIQARGQVVELDVDGREAVGARPVDFEFDARCDAGAA